MRIETGKYQAKDVATIWLLSVVAFTIAGCTPPSVFSLEPQSGSEMKTPITIIVIPDMGEYDGFATLEDIVIFGDGDLKQLSHTISHEEKHIGQIKKAGGTIPYWIEYWSDPIQACTWEKEAGATHHQVCDLAETNKLAVK